MLFGCEKQAFLDRAASARRPSCVLADFSHRAVIGEKVTVSSYLIHEKITSDYFDFTDCQESGGYLGNNLKIFWNLSSHYFGKYLSKFLFVYILGHACLICRTIRKRKYWTEIFIFRCIYVNLLVFFILMIHVK
jgi:hypothetical protein